MAKPVNFIRNTTAILKKKTGINSPAVYYAVNDGADGYPIVEVSSLPSVELFIGQGTQAQDDITEWTLFNSQANYGGVGANAFGRFPNLEKITIFQEATDSVLTIDDNAFSTNVELEKIYVHPDLLASYQNTYAEKPFVSLFDSYELVTDLIIPSLYNGIQAPTTLTKEWIDTVIADMPQLLRNAKTTVIVPEYFLTIAEGAFSGLSSFTYITELKCNGTKTFNAGFLNGASWCIHLWLDNGSDTFNGAYVTDSTTLNANFRTLAPYLVFANYFMNEYPSHYPVIGYNLFTSGDTLPQTSSTGEYLWFSNINFDTDYNSPTGLENDDSFIDDYEADINAIYYCYDKTETLVIQDDGTHIITSELLTASINSLDTPLEWITKVIIPNSLNTMSEQCFKPLFDNLPNIKVCEMGVFSGFYGPYSAWSGRGWSRVIDKIIYTGTGQLSGTSYFVSSSVAKEWEFVNGFTGNWNSPYGYYAGTLDKLTYRKQGSNQEKYPAKEVHIYEHTTIYKDFTNGAGYKVWVYSIETAKNTSQTLSSTKVYVPADGLEWYMTATNWSSISSALIGFLDYTDTIPTFTDYTDQWYSDEDCTTPIATTDFVSGNRYFVKLTAI